MSTATFFQSEVSNLLATLNVQCERYWNDDICDITAQEWAKNLTNTAIEFFCERDEMATKFKIGQKVHLAGVPLGDPLGDPYVTLQYGRVGHNYVLFATEYVDGDGYGPHGYEEERALMDAETQHLVDPESGLTFAPRDQYSKAMARGTAQILEKRERAQHMAKMVFVVWHDKDDNIIARAWYDPEQLVEIE